jgi:hypothetical protein
MWVRQKCAYWKRKNLASASSRNLEQIMNFARAATAESGSDNCQFALDDSGMMLFAPIEAEVGDFVCQGRDHNTLVIARATKTRCQLIGRALSLFDVIPAHSDNRCRCALEDRTIERRVPRYDRFQCVVTLSTLQRLTIGSGDQPIWGGDIR